MNRHTGFPACFYYGHVPADNRIETGFLRCLYRFLNILYFIIIYHGIKCQIGFCSILPAKAGDIGKIIVREVATGSTHIISLSAEIHCIGSSLKRGKKRRAVTCRGNEFKSAGCGHCQYLLIVPYDNSV